MSIDDGEHLAEIIASTIAPWVTYAVHTRDQKMVADLLTSLTIRELWALVVVLADRCPRPLMRPDDGVIDEIAVARAAAGEPVPLTGAERVEAARLLIEHGHGPAKIAQRLHVAGTTARRLYQQATAERGAT